MGLLRLAAPGESLVLLAEVKQRLKIETADDDSGLQRLISACTRQAEQRTQRAFVTQQWAYMAASFPCGSIVLPLPPLQSVQVIKYIDTNGTEQTLSPSNYVVDPSGLLGVVSLASGKSWPNTLSHPQALRVEFTCGYGAAALVEPDIVLAVLLLIAHFDQNREAVSGRQLNVLPIGVEELLAPYCIPVGF